MSDEDSPAFLLWLSALFVAVGLSLVGLGIAHFREQAALSANLTNSETVSQYFPWAQKRPLKTSFSALPHFGLVIATALILVPVWVITFPRYIPAVLHITVLRPGVVPPRASFLPEPLVARIEAGPGTSVNLYLNSRKVSREDFTLQLTQELGRRPSTWPVYVKGGKDLHWQDVVTVIDIIEGEHAKVVLLTDN